MPVDFFIWFFLLFVFILLIPAKFQSFFFFWSFFFLQSVNPAEFQHDWLWVGTTVPKRVQLTVTELQIYNHRQVNLTSTQFCICQFQVQTLWYGPGRPFTAYRFWLNLCVDSARAALGLVLSVSDCEIHYRSVCVEPVSRSKEYVRSWIKIGSVLCLCRRVCLELMEGIICCWMASFFVDVPLMEFTYLIFTRTIGESYRRRPATQFFRLLCLCDVFRVLINPLVCWFIRRVAWITVQRLYQYWLHEHSSFVLRRRYLPDSDFWCIRQACPGAFQWLDGHTDQTELLPALSRWSDIQSVIFLLVPPAA